MIDIFFWRTPNCSKITIFCEEAGLDYRILPINIGTGDQLTADYRAINPNARVPAIIDHDGSGNQPIRIFKSGAILMYLAEKTGRFLPSDVRKRYEVVQWLMFQMGGFGPMLGQAHHFRMYAQEQINYAIRRYTNEASRLYGVLDLQLQDKEFVAVEYSIADMAIVPWVMPYKRQGQELSNFPNVRRWFDSLKARPAVKKGLDVGKDLQNSDPFTIDDKTREILFGVEYGH